MSIGIVASSYVAAGGGGGFSPGDISGLVVWLEADDLDATLNDGDTVTAWSDKSSNSNAPSITGTPTFRPGSTPTGADSVEFDQTFSSTGAAEWLSWGNIMASASSGEVAIVVKADFNRSQRRSALWDFGSSSLSETYTYVASGEDNSAGDWYEEWGRTTRPLSVSGATGGENWNIIQIRTASGDYEIYRGGSSVYSTATNTVGWDTTPTLGRGSLPEGFGGRIAAFVVYNTTLTSQERSDLYDYLDAKYVTP